MPIKEYVTRLKKITNLSLKQNLPFSRDRVSGAMRYAVFSGGKKLRPILFLATFESLGGKINKSVMDVSAGIEFIHAFSLIQDDLPCMDNDDFRRGKPSVHKSFGEDTALLASDSLLNSAYKLITDSPGLSAQLKVRIISELTQAVKSLIYGQAGDLDLTLKKAIPLFKLNKIYLNKTGMLICACVRIAGILRNQNKRQLEELSRFGRKFGLAYQILDDVLNVASDKKAFRGKRGSDERRKKTGYVSLRGISDSRFYAKKLIQEAKKDLLGINIRPDNLSLLCDLTLRRLY